ncbi:MauE/DoxX family redox-associated membrane protein [Litorivivens sp.]|uniref:MauE/DoxX family redox-associated membrane protein n=1 Tax=Litorivivens sp. TaxID=2020868 RepID=UPI003563CC08
MDTLVRRAHVYRTATCPWGKKAADLLASQHINFMDHTFASREEEEAFKRQEGVSTTPQVYLDGRRIGGYTELAQRLNSGLEGGSDEGQLQAYLPVVAVFATALLMALASGAGLMGFMGFSLCLLACLKLMDLRSFVDGFMQYDLLAPRVPTYGWTYPFLELAVGLALLGSMALTPMAWVALVVGVIGGTSILKAVYVDKQDLNCACVGGNYDVPLGFVSFTENAVMAGMGAAILLRLM